MSTADAILQRVTWTSVPPPANHEQDELPYPTHEGVISIEGMFDLKCYQLSNGQRIIDMESFKQWLASLIEGGADAGVS